MNKTGISKKIANQMAISQKQALTFVKTFEKVIEEVLLDEDTVTLQGFGSFNVWRQTERLGRNPKTGAAAIIHMRNSVKFKPGINLLEALKKK